VFRGRTTVSARVSSSITFGIDGGAEAEPRAAGRVARNERTTEARGIHSPCPQNGGKSNTKHCRFQRLVAITVKLSVPTIYRDVELWRRKLGAAGRSGSGHNRGVKDEVTR